MISLDALMVYSAYPLVAVHVAVQVSVYL